VSESQTVRVAREGELAAVLNVLDGGALATSAGRIEQAIGGGDVLVATAGESNQEERIIGALVLDGETITAVAVRPRRRDQGIGTALVEAAAQRRERLVAEFDPHVRPFWNSLGFEISPVDDTDRYRGLR
jgi:GNAT superfamily N-acetyltransferase